MRRLLPLVLFLALPGTAHAQARIFDLAGSGTIAGIRDGEPATSAGLLTGAPIAVLPQGGFLVGGGESVWSVDAQGRVHDVAGTGRNGQSGDGGPARSARVTVDGLAVLPQGGFLIVDGLHDRVRMVDANGAISTVAGGGTRKPGGVPAIQARLDALRGVAALPGGGFLVSDYRGIVDRVGPDGIIRPFAGNGAAKETRDLHGQPATAVSIDVSSLSVQPDGGVLIADYLNGRVDRVAPGGTISTLAPTSVDDFIHPRGAAATPDGGALVFDDPIIERARVVKVAPDGTLTTLAGGASIAFTAPSGLAQRLNGGPAQRATFQDAAAIAALPDGGVLLSDGVVDDSDIGGMVRYLAPPRPAILAVAILRDRDRLIADKHVTLALSLPATVTLTVAGKHTTSALPAGVSRVPLPSPPATRPLTVSVAATDGTRGAFDSSRIYPAPWLATETARLVAVSTGNVVVQDCRRRTRTRVDCKTGIAPDCGVTSVTYGHSRISWGRTRCGARARPRYHALRRSELACDAELPKCPLPLYGRRDEAALLPSD